MSIIVAFFALQLSILASFVECRHSLQTCSTSIVEELLFLRPSPPQFSLFSLSLPPFSSFPLPLRSGVFLVMASVTMSTTPHVALAAAAEVSQELREGLGGQDLAAIDKWEPKRDMLVAIVNLLTHSTNAQSNVQSHLFAQLQLHAQQGDFNNYLAYIMARADAVEQIAQMSVGSHQVTAVRQAAGLLLKSNIRMVYSTLHPHVRAFVNARLVDAIGDESQHVREVVASCISTLVLHNTHLVAISGLATSLVVSLDSVRPTFLDGSLTVISRLAEDAPHLLAEDPSQPLDILLPKIIHLCRHHSENIRVRSLHTLNHLILVMPPSLQANIDLLCNTLFSVAEDTSPQVRKRVCTSICLLFNTAPHALSPYLTSIIEYMLQSSTHSDQQVAKEATEFWALLAERKTSAEALRPFLPRLISALLTNMVYSSEEMVSLDAAASPDDMIPDKPEDIPPHFLQQRFKDTSSNSNNTVDFHNDQKVDHMSSAMVMTLPQVNGHAEKDVNTSQIADQDPSENTATHSESQMNGFHDASDSDDGDESDDEDSNFSSVGEDAEWNLRRSSAAALDAVACLFGDGLLEVVLPRLHDKLTNSERWEQRECGVLALGAIAEGCRSGVDAHMRTIFPFLLHSASDQHYMVRCISCWALSRYSKWIIEKREDAAMQQLLSVLLDRMLDRNKVVQKASCSALASFEEDGAAYLSSYLTPILRTVTVAFERYQQSNLYLLFDVVCALAEGVGNELANPEHMNVLMPLLISRWNALSDFDTVMPSLLECLGYVFRAIGINSQQFAANVVTRCANIMDVVYSKESKGEQEDMNVAFLISPLELISGIATALGASVDPYVAKSGSGSKPLLPLLFVAMRDNRQEVRQSAFALLGEFAAARMPSLIPALPEYVKYTVDALDPEYMSVANNATWALGELIMMAGFLPPSVPVDRETIQRTLLERAAEPLIRVVNTPHLNKSLLENSAITLGRLGLVMPDAMSSKLGSFAESMLALLRNTRDDTEKEQAFHGMNGMVRRNPTAILNCFVYYVDAIASWYHCKPDLELEFATILGGYKASLGDRWAVLVTSFPASLQQLLADRFRL